MTAARLAYRRAYARRDLAAILAPYTLQQWIRTAP